MSGIPFILKLRGYVGTRFIASTLEHNEPGPGRDQSRPYMGSLIHLFMFIIASMSHQIGISGGRNELRPYFQIRLERGLRLISWIVYYSLLYFLYCCVTFLRFQACFLEKW